ncbi:3-beta-hydroxysteroid dehydrogenase [Whalleya microplaca]|nr:3-beta-hydroxysteroid dehydrogenase [Whalleya microplaca]
MPGSKVAIVTGGASGIGLGVAETFLRKGWRVHIFDLNEPKDNAAVFHKVDVASWSHLHPAFDAVFKAEGRLDFVFANAGVMEKGNFYEKHDITAPIPPPQDINIDVNLKGIIKTSYLAQHYFRANQNGGRDCVLIMTSSIAGIYPQESTPLYSAAKAGMLNFMRSVAPMFYQNDGIRTFAICPGSTRTNILPKELWDAFPQEHLTQMDKVASTVMSLVEGTPFEDSWGKKFGKSDIGLTVEIFVGNVYYRSPAEPCNDDMAFVLDLLRPK